MKRTFLKVIGLALVAALAASCGGTDDDDDQSPGTILKLAERSGEISALALAARKAGLADELDAPDSNLTVLAPSDDAFARLAGQLGYASISDLIDALSAEQLQAILSYHLLPTAQTKADLLAGGSSQTTLLVQDGNPVALGVNLSNEQVRLVDSVSRLAVVNLFDVPNDNGVLHVIDRVLIPAGVLTVLQTVQANPERFLALASLVSSPALVETLNGDGPFTLFAPTNAAFLAAGSVLSPLTAEQIDTLLKYHVVGAALPSSAFTFGTPVATLAGQPFTINAGTGGALALIDDTTTTDAGVTAVDIVASNGVVHVVNKVLMPTLTD
jgi:uncharacterized surface protein with fasciclin (FAS1) repeats